MKIGPLQFIKASLQNKLFTVLPTGFNYYLPYRTKVQSVLTNAGLNMAVLGVGSDIFANKAKPRPH